MELGARALAAFYGFFTKTSCPDAARMSAATLSSSSRPSSTSKSAICSADSFMTSAICTFVSVFEATAVCRSRNVRLDHIIDIGHRVKMFAPIEFKISRIRFRTARERQLFFEVPLLL